MDYSWGLIVHFALMCHPSHSIFFFASLRGIYAFWTHSLFLTLFMVCGSAELELFYKLPPVSQTIASFLERTVVTNFFSHLKPYIITWLTYLEHHQLHAKIDGGWILSTFCMKFNHCSYFLYEPFTLFFLVSESHICMIFCRLEENEKLLLTPFEKNLDIWRQLWRVLERSDLVSVFLSLNLDLTITFLFSPSGSTWCNFLLQFLCIWNFFNLLKN